MPCGKWFTCLYHRKNYTETLAIENVSKSQRSYLLITNDVIFIDLSSFLETKSQFARDDPAFLVLLIVCLFGKHFIRIAANLSLNHFECLFLLYSSVTSIGFTWTLNLSFGQTLYCIAYILIVDFILAGIISTTITWFIANRYLRQNLNEADVEWGYSFDVHTNAFFPPLILLHFVQLIFFNSEFQSTFLCIEIHW